MNPLNDDVFDLIDEWVKLDEWKKDDHGYEHDEEMNVFITGYDAPWFRDDADDADDPENDEENYFTFHLRIYIWEDRSYKIEFDEGLFHLMYKGYETEEDRSAWEEFKSAAKERGLLYEKS